MNFEGFDINAHFRMSISRSYRELAHEKATHGAFFLTFEIHLIIDTDI